MRPGMVESCDVDTRVCGCVGLTVGGGLLVVVLGADYAETIPNSGPTVLGTDTSAPSLAPGNTCCTHPVSVSLSARVRQGCSHALAGYDRAQLGLARSVVSVGCFATVASTFQRSPLSPGS